MAPSSIFALSLKPSVWYLTLNFPAFWKYQITLPSLAYAGIPYHVFGVRVGAAAVISAWTFVAMARSGSCILAIAASSSVFPSALAASALSSRTRSRAAAFSSALNPLDTVSFALVRFARFCVVLVAVLVGVITRAPVRELTRTTLSLLLRSLATLVRAVVVGMQRQPRTTGR